MRAIFKNGTLKISLNVLHLVKKITVVTQKLDGHATHDFLSVFIQKVLKRFNSGVGKHRPAKFSSKYLKT